MTACTCSTSRCKEGRRLRRGQAQWLALVLVSIGVALASLAAMLSSSGIMLFLPTAAVIQKSRGTSTVANSNRNQTQMAVLDLVVRNELRLCRDEALHLPHPDTYGTSTNTTTNITIMFNCVGPEYEAFGDRLWQFAQNQSSVAGMEHWGRRPAPLPANRSVLLFGNSHLRQIGHAIVGQYADQVVNATCLDPPGNNICFFHFANHAAIHVVTNTAIVHSPDWPVLLQQYITGRPLASFDAVVLGKFNHWNEMSSRFRATMQRNGATLNSSSIINVRSIVPPSVPHVAALYPGPMMAVSMFAEQTIPQSLQMQTDIEHLINGTRTNATTSSPSPKRTKFAFLNGRRYIATLGECGSDNKGGVGLCENGEKRSPSHRCTGQRGGHPDLLAWDVLEQLDQMLEPIS